MKPSSDQRRDGWLWKLKKPLYGLDDAKGKLWLKLKDTLLTKGLKVMPGDAAFYYLHEDGRLQGLC